MSSAATAGKGGVAGALRAQATMGTAGQGAAANGGSMSGVAAVGGNVAAAVGGNGGAGGAEMQPALGTLHAPSCPTSAPQQGASFCYDVEQGTKGPNDGDAFSLWDTPENATPTELSTEERPVGSGNHVLLVSPPLVGMYPSATLGHDTLPFSRALAEFDFWANPALINVDKDVVFFRYAPNENDFDHLTTLILRRGEAILRTEDNSSQELRLSMLPSASDKTHVSVVLDHGSDCRVQVYFDEALVVSSDRLACAAQERGQVGFVEYGLVEPAGPVGPISALYDNLALGME